MIPEWKEPIMVGQACSSQDRRSGGGEVELGYNLPKLHPMTYFLQ